MSGASPFVAHEGAAGSTPLLIGAGSIWHRRLRPAENEFTYPGYFLLLPMRAWREARTGDTSLARNRFAPMSFHDRDHGEGGEDALRWFEQLLLRNGVQDADGEIWLQTFPRLWGHAFKPVSFWYALRRDGTPAAILAEVNNTFGERHCYLLEGGALRWDTAREARKAFHVSPFCPVAGRYSFRFLARPWTKGGKAGVLAARVDYNDGAGPLLQTAIRGRLEPLDRSARLRALLRMPAMSLSILWRIHWQALRLFSKRVPWFPKPAPAFPSLTR